MWCEMNYILGFILFIILFIFAEYCCVGNNTLALIQPLLRPQLEWVWQYQYWSRFGGCGTLIGCVTSSFFCSLAPDQLKVLYFPLHTSPNPSGKQSMNTGMSLWGFKLLFVVSERGTITGNTIGNRGYFLIFFCFM